MENGDKVAYQNTNNPQKIGKKPQQKCGGNQTMTLTNCTLKTNKKKVQQRRTLKVKEGKWAQLLNKC